MLMVFRRIARMLSHHHWVGQNLTIRIPQQLWYRKAGEVLPMSRVLWGPGQSQLGHGYVEVVPRTHPQFIFVWLRSVTGAPQGAPQNQPLVIIGGTAIILWLSHPLPLWRALRLLCGHLGLSEQLWFGGGALRARAAAGAGGRHGGLLRADSSQCFIPVFRCYWGSRSWTLEGVQGLEGSLRCGAVQGDPFLQSGGQFVKFFKVLGQARAEGRRQDLEIVVGVHVQGPWGGDGMPCADNGAVLGHIDAPVNVSVAVQTGRDAAVLSRWAALIFSVHHQLDPTFSAAQLQKGDESLKLEDSIYTFELIIIFFVSALLTRKQLLLKFNADFTDS